MAMQKESSTNKMNILNLADRDEGGAGIASRNFNELFINADHNSILVVKQSKLQNNNVIVLEKLPSRNSLSIIIMKVKNRLIRFINNKKELFDPKYGFFNTDETKQYYTAEEILKVVPFKPDVIILHWISNFINSKTINELAEITQAKILWIMMDNAPLTGGCHYPWACLGYQADCSDCPAILDPSKRNIAKRNLALKKDFLPDNIEVIACSKDDYIRARKSFIFRQNKIHKLIFPINENKFLPGDKKAAKSFFRIAQNVKVIFCGSISLGRKRKGGQFLLDSMIKLQNKLLEDKNKLDDILILTVGKNKNDIYKNIEIPIMQVEYLNEESLIKSYQAADVFVSPSIEDSGPLMVNQAVMCGTPVVAFEIGVALDIVHTGKTGYRAKLGDCEDLAIGIKYMIEMKEPVYYKIAKNCRLLAEKEYSLEKTALTWNKFLNILSYE